MIDKHIGAKTLSLRVLSYVQDEKGSRPADDVWTMIARVRSAD